MIVGTGIDIVDISRIKLEQAKRILSDDENSVFKNFKLNQRKIEYLAGRFALKEAIIKAIGHTKYKLGMRDITILNEENGMPKIVYPSFNDMKFHITLSHEHSYAIGMCIIEKI